MIEPEDIVGGEWADWYRLTPQQRWRESEKLWEVYLALGGSLDPEPDPQSPFFETFKAYDEHASSTDPFAGYESLRKFRQDDA